MTSCDHDPFPSDIDVCSYLSVLFPCIICQFSAVSDRISRFACLQAKAVEVAGPKPTTAEDVGPRDCGLEAAAADCTDIR